MPSLARARAQAPVAVAGHALSHSRPRSILHRLSISLSLKRKGRLSRNLSLTLDTECDALSQCMRPIESGSRRGHAGCAPQLFARCVTANDCLDRALILSLPPP
eukprot:350521-Chlamydomonas_euryale.AAC.10